MYYEFNPSRSRIEIKCDSVVVAFIQYNYLKHYPYFDRLSDEQNF